MEGKKEKIISQGRGQCVLSLEKEKKNKKVDGKTGKSKWTFEPSVLKTHAGVSVQPQKCTEKKNNIFKALVFFSEKIV